jgi:hypothetical protein
MAKRDFKRAQGFSFCPRSSSDLGQEIEEEKMLRMGKGAYYAAKGKLRSKKEKEALEDYLEQERRHRRDVQLRIERLEMIRQAAEKDW